MDAIFTVLNEAAVILLPILGAIVLFFLAILIYKLIKTLDNLQRSLSTVDHTLTQVDKYVGQLEQPVSTLLRVSAGVNTVANTTETIISKLIKFIMENFEWLKETVVDLFKTDEEPDESEGGTVDE